MSLNSFKTIKFIKKGIRNYSDRIFVRNIVEGCTNSMIKKFFKEDIDSSTLSGFNRPYDKKTGKALGYCFFDLSNISLSKFRDKYQRKYLFGSQLRFKKAVTEKEVIQ